MTDNEAQLEYERVKVLFDYTKFHIGLYTTLGTLIISIVSVKLPSNVTIEFSPVLLWAAVLFIGVAGLAGGVIASTLPACKSLEYFFTDKTGFWSIHPFSGKTWTHIEHTAFWFGLISASLSFLVG